MKKNSKDLKIVNVINLIEDGENTDLKDEDTINDKNNYFISPDEIENINIDKEAYIELDLSEDEDDSINITDKKISESLKNSKEIEKDIQIIIENDNKISKDFNLNENNFENLLMNKFTNQKNFLQILREGKIINLNDNLNSFMKNIQSNSFLNNLNKKLSKLDINKNKKCFKKLYEKNQNLFNFNTNNEIDSKIIFHDKKNKTKELKNNDDDYSVELEIISNFELCKDQLCFNKLYKKSYKKLKKLFFYTKNQLYY